MESIPPALFYLAAVEQALIDLYISVVDNFFSFACVCFSFCSAKKIYNVIYHAVVIHISSYFNIFASTVSFWRQFLLTFTCKSKSMR